MKQTKRFVAFLVAVALVFLSGQWQMTPSAGAEESTAVTVTLRMETDADTVLAPVTVTMTEEDKNNDFGVGLATGAAATFSPLRAFAKYLATTKQISNEDMSKYIIASPSFYGGLFVQGLSVAGDGIGAAGVDGEVSWMYSVNGQQGDTSMDMYACKEKDNVVIYGSYYHMVNPDTYEAVSSEYVEFDKKEIRVEAGEKFTVSLKAYGVSYDENFNATPYTKPVADATVYAVAKGDGVQGATAKNATVTAKTDKDGKAELTFAGEGEYLLSAGKLAEDGVHNLITRPYADVTVTKKAVVQPSAKPTTSVSPAPREETLKKPAKVTKVSAKVAKAKAAKKKVTVKWKKASKAKGYQVYVSKKDKKHFKKQAAVKKTKAVLKLKKGLYFVKVRAYNKVGNTMRKGAFSKIVKIRVK